MKNYKNKSKIKTTYFLISLVFIPLSLSLANAYELSDDHKDIQNLDDSLLAENIKDIHENCIYFVKGNKYTAVKDHLMSNSNPSIFKEKVKGGLK